MDDVVFRLLRELPDTDKDRYDIAYERGRAQARSSLLFGGIALGLVAGALGAFLLARAEVAQRARAFLNDLRPTTPQTNVERPEAIAATAAASRHEVRTPPRSAAASVMRREEATDRVSVAAATEER
jgi:hypothetical protein